jgi:hypothetical protein
MYHASTVLVHCENTTTTTTANNNNEGSENGDSDDVDESACVWKENEHLFVSQTATSLSAFFRKHDSSLLSSVFSARA